MIPNARTPESLMALEAYGLNRQLCAAMDEAWQSFPTPTQKRPRKKSLIGSYTIHLDILTPLHVLSEFQENPGYLPALKRNAFRRHYFFEFSAEIWPREALLEHYLIPQRLHQYFSLCLPVITLTPLYPC